MAIEYIKPPIKKTSLLYLAMGVTPTELDEIIKNKNSYYAEVLVNKNGKERRAHNIRGKLRKILVVIKKRIFENVKYPKFLHGSLKKRGSGSNASAHLGGGGSMIVMDIKNFFPSITRGHIFRLFHSGFRFSNAMSRKLADVITYNGVLPVGSPVSSFVANCIFHGQEEELADFCARKNCVYTRYVDDITVSSRRKLTNADKAEIKQAINHLIRKNGFSVKHGKTKIYNRRDTKIVSGYGVNSGKVKVPKAYREKLAAEINGLTESDIDDAIIRSIRGKINYIRKHSPTKGGELLNMLLRKIET